MKLALTAILSCLAIQVSAEMADFEKPPAGLKSRTTEYWDIHDDDLTAKHFNRKVAETFDEKGELTSREYSDSDGKTEKLTYKHVYDEKGQIKERLELDANGTVHQRWTYKKGVGGKLEITMRLVLSGGDMVYAYRFDAQGRLEELECLQCKGSKTKLINNYDSDGLLKDQTELLEGKLRYKTEFEYDKKGALRRAVKRNDMEYLSTEDLYDAAGNLESTTTYDHYGDEVTAKFFHEYTYDDNGRVTEDDWIDAKIEMRKLVVVRGHNYYKCEFYEKK